jgi:DNA repair exonuclease SbcCD nuclease subunit
MPLDRECKVVKLGHNVVNFVYITDVHLSAEAPGRRQDDYMDAIFAKLEFVRQLTEKVHGVCLCGGDVFHVKNPWSKKNPLAMIERLIRVFASFPREQIFGTIGNHDLSMDNLSGLPGQPLGVVIASGAYHNLAEQPIIFKNADESVRVLVESVGYCGTLGALKWLHENGNPTSSPRITLDVNYRVAIMHAYSKAGDRTNLYTEPVIGYNELAELDFDIILWGHDHSRKETETVGNVTHVNLGSLARAAFSSDEIDRPVCATIISFGDAGIKMKEKHVPVQPLEIAFKAADRATEKVRKQEAVTNFFTAMDEAVSDIESSDPKEVLEQLCPDNKPVLDTAIEMCEL